MDKIIRSMPVTGSRRLSDRGTPGGQRGDRQRQKEADQSSARTYGAADAVIRESEAEQVEKTDSATSGDKAATAVTDRLQKDNDDLQRKLAALETELAESRKEADRLREEQRSRGYQDGFEQGSVEGKKTYDERVAAIGDLAKALRGACDSEIENLGSVAVEVALTALCRIVEESLFDEAFVASVVRRALMTVKEERKVEVRVNPSQLDTLREQSSSLARVFRGNSLELVGDPRVVLGGCLLETDNGNWDGRLETQLQRLLDLAGKSDAKGHGR